MESCGLQDPPNFLRASDLSSHVTPVVVVPEPPPEPEPEPEMVVGDLVDTSTPPVTPVSCHDYTQSLVIMIMVIGTFC